MGTEGQEEADDSLKRHLRATILVKTFYKMTDSWTQGERDACKLNEEILWMSVNAYFRDIKRKKQFHGIKYADAHKRAGYMVKWIMRFRPVQIVAASTKRVYLANELLAMAHALKMVNVAPSSVPDSLREHLLYMLRFRTIDPNALAMSFFLLQKLDGKSTGPTHG